MSQRPKLGGKTLSIKLPTDVMAALATAGFANYELPSAYARRAIVEKLRAEGFLSPAKLDADPLP